MSQISVTPTAQYVRLYVGLPTKKVIVDIPVGTFVLNERNEFESPLTANFVGFATGQPRYYNYAKVYNRLTAPGLPVLVDPMLISALDPAAGLKYFGINTNGTNLSQTVQVTQG